MSIYTRFSPDDIVSANPTVVTTGLWSGDTGSLKQNSMYLNNEQVESLTSGIYYFDVYNKDVSNELAEVQFALAYGNVNGGGAPRLDQDEQTKLPTKATYSQYRSLLLDPSDTKFTFIGGESDHIYVINLQRARIREQLDPGNWILPLSGTNGAFTFIDDSGQTRGALTANSKSGRVFNVVSGSLTGISGSTVATSASSAGLGFGLVYPDLGIIILNPDAIVPLVGFVSRSATGGAATGSISEPLYAKNTISAQTLPYAPVTHSLQWSGLELSSYNHAGLFVSMRLALNENDPALDLEFRARSAETISSTHYFVRLRNKEYNYSNNPTFYNADTGTLILSEFRNDPRVYITTIGLYNDANELLAVAKLSKPVQKSFDEELLLRVRLDF